jgi:hypothetical protein
VAVLRSAVLFVLSARIVSKTARFWGSGFWVLGSGYWLLGWVLVLGTNGAGVLWSLV